MKCTVVVPTFNRLPLLKQSLAALLSLDYADDYEIVVVNDGSNDGTKDYLNGLNNPAVKVIHHAANLGLAQAKNSGIKVAAYDIIVFTDDDCLVDKSWLTFLLTKFVDNNIHFVFGRTIYRHLGYKGYFPERLVNNNNGQWPAGGNIAYRKEVFLKAGYYSDEFYFYNNEDTEMAIRAVNYGYKYWSEKRAMVFHQRAFWNVSALLKSARNASVWVLLKQRYPQTYREFKPPIFGGLVIHIVDYFFILFLPVLLPVLFIRYLWHGNRDFKIFFFKWPVYLFLRRWYVYKEAFGNKVFIF